MPAMRPALFSLAISWGGKEESLAIGGRKGGRGEGGRNGGNLSELEVLGCSLVGGRLLEILQALGQDYSSIELEEVGDRRLKEMAGEGR